jgi:hypothetical protein
MVCSTSTVVLDDADVPEAQLREAREEAAYAGRVHLDAEIVVLGVLLRDRRSCLAHAEADFENLRSPAAEQALQVE